MQLISSIEDLTPQRLTNILLKGGYLKSGQVKAIESTAINANAANRAYRIHVIYGREVTPPSAPKRLFLKISEPHLLFATHEVFFYNEILPEMEVNRGALPFIECFDAVFDTDRQQAHLLLQDLSETHTKSVGPIPPSISDTRGMIEALATLHAHWWEHPSLGRGIGEIRGAQNIQSMVDSARRRSSQYIRYMGDRLSPARKQAIQKICSKWPNKRFQRHTNGVGITLVHRDAQPHNFLFPKNPQKDRVILTDWQSWRVDTGTDDLAYLMAAHWYPERRARLEMPLLIYYHQCLLDRGVTNYSWEDCLYDYKASIIRVIFIFAGGWRKRRDPNLYYERLEKSLIAFDDLKCAELL